MEERRLRVARTARYYVMAGADRAPREVWLACHGYGQLAARFARALLPLRGPSRLVVVPEALSRFYLEAGRDAPVGASWMTREDRLAEIADYVAYLDAVYADVVRGVDRGSARLGVLGYSQGAATACRWTALGAGRVDRLILWGGEVPPDLDLEAARPRLAGAHLVLVAGERDEYLTPKVLARDSDRLRAAGIAHEVRRFAGGHEIESEVLEDLVRE